MLFRVWIWTNNQRKKEINSDYFWKKGLKAELRGFSDLWLTSPVEDAKTIEGNALIKFNVLKGATTQEIQDILKGQKILPIFANDSWIVIDNFDWFWAESRRDEDGNYLEDAWVAKRLSRVASSLSPEKRTAHIISCYVTGYINEVKGDCLSIVESRQSWIITDRPSEIVIPNMPFNSVFIPNWYNKPLSEFTTEEFQNWILNEKSFVENIEIIKSIVK